MLCEVMEDLNCKFRKFASEYNFLHIPSSPYHSQSHGEVESAVKNDLLKKKESILDALLEYRLTPLSNGYNPAELMMGRKLKHYPKKSMRKSFKEKQIINYYKIHKVVELKALHPGQTVWITDLKKDGIVQKECQEYPRSYIVKIKNRIYRRNRILLIPTKNVYEESKDCEVGLDIEDFITIPHNQQIEDNQDSTVPDQTENEVNIPDDNVGDEIPSQWIMQYQARPGMRINLKKQ